MEGKYSKYIIDPPHMHMTVKDDGRTVFDGLFVKENCLGYPFAMGHQFVTKPFKSDNPAHTHNFQEFLAWYSGDPDNPTELGGEVVLYLGEELEKYVITKPTMVSLPAGLVHCPLEITRVDHPFIQIEIMLKPEDGSAGTREAFFDADKYIDPMDAVDITYYPSGE